MKNHSKLHIIAIVCMFALAACNGLAAPTATPKPSSTPAPTNTPQPTSTLTPTAQPTLALGERQKVNAGGYSLQVPLGFKTEIRNAQTTINNQDSTILISMTTAARQNDTQTAETVLTGFIANVKQLMTDLNASDPYPIKIGNLDGLAIDVSGTYKNEASTGQAAIADMGQSGFFVVFALAQDGTGEKQWIAQGHPIFDATLHSVEFFTPVVESSTCTAIASDATYGYTKENPIKVGGDDFGGPPREREYLDNLAGPNGEKISYSRTGSINFGNTILDAFVIRGLSKEVTLYIDEYSFTEPQAPVGFTCLATFTLEKP